MDPHPLAFNSVVDVAANTYGYSRASGSTYLGQAASLQVSGAFDDASQSWHWTSTGQDDHADGQRNGQGDLDRETHGDLILMGADEGKWKWDTGAITGLNGTFALGAEGFSPIPDGGQGAFTMTVTAVPEPSTLMSAGIVLCVFLIYRGLAGVGRDRGMGGAGLYPFPGGAMDRGSV